MAETKVMEDSLGMGGHRRRDGQLSKRGKPEQFQGLRDSQARQNRRLHSVAEIR